MISSTRFLTTSTLPCCKLPTSTPPAGDSSFGPDHVSKEAHAAAIAGIESASSASADPTLQRALDKLKQGVELLLSLGDDALCGAALRAQWHKLQEADDRVGRSTRRIEQHFRRLASQHKERLQLVQRRQRARESGSFWQRLGSLFGKLAELAGLAVSALTGGTVGLVAAAALATSMVMGAAGANEWATFSVGAGGLILGGWVKNASGALKALAQKIGRYAKFGLKVSQACAKAIAAGKDSRAAHAQADLHALRTERQRLLDESAKERETMESLRRATHRSALALIELLSQSHITKRAALGAR